MTIAELIRIASAVLATVAFAFWIRNAIRAWPERDRHDRRVIVAMGILLAIIAYGCGEAATSDLPLYPRTVLTALSLAGLVVTLLWDDDTKPPKGTHR